MSSSYLSRAASPLQTPQSEPIPGSSQVPNSAGGHAWEIGSMDRLRRFLVLGSEGGSYYASERKLTRENIDGVRAALDEHKTDAVREIVNISKSGRAPKNDPALYALAVACAHKDSEVRKLATESIIDVARTGTHLFHFVEFAQSQRGWGPALKKGIAAWYEREDIEQLAYQLVKYRQRDGWTHHDLLRLSHPTAQTKSHAELYDWICGREIWSQVDQVPCPSIAGYLESQRSSSAHRTSELIDKYGSSLPREALNTEHLNSPDVWKAMLKAGMPMTALIRNLATMTRIGVLKPMGNETKLVIEHLTNSENIHKARIHPLSVLGAMTTYTSGYSARGSTSWEPLREIIDALDDTFYLAFKNVEPSNRRTMLALDVSGSMDGYYIAGMPGITPRVGSAAMALITSRTEPNYHIMAFSHKFVPVNISHRERLDNVVHKISSMPFGGTDCSLPIMYALENNIDVDTFVVYTDSETWYGNIHPAQALNKYQRKTGIKSKLIVVGMVSNKFSIADPNNLDMLDVVGFDSAAPQIISDFSSGKL
jgi:60 kDa SS-A/Ro ribonucleoprotein